jgi:nicotinate dehydrogenase subunit B
MSAHLDRRAFLKLVGGGIVVFVRLGPTDALAQGRAYPTDVNAYLRIGEDGRVTVFSGKIEMGQGVMTSLAQMAAEDLGVSLDSIEMIMGDTDRCPWDMGTFGSLTTRMFGPALRAAAAEARQILLGLAADRLGVPKDRLVVENGIVSVTGEPSRKVSYGALAKGQAITRTVGEKAVQRAVAEFTVMGRSPRRLDAVDKVTGAGKYAADIRMPGLLHARILRPPAHGATLARVDTS